MTNLRRTCFTKSLALIAAHLSVLMVGAMIVHAADWPQWRGVDGQGHAGSDAKNLATQWDAESGKNIKWNLAIPGHGHSSPVVEGNRIWLTTSTIVPENKARATERLKDNKGGMKVVVAAQATYFAICVDLESGKQLHNIKLFTIKEPQWIHPLNSYASCSPIIENGLLYCHFGSSGTVCLDTKTLKPKWLQKGVQAQHENGPGSTPIICGDHLIFHMDGSDVQYITALNKKTGKVAWRTNRTGKMNNNPQLKKAYGTPLLVNVKGKSQVISPAADWVYAYDPETGEELWKQAYGILGFSLVPKPVAGHGMVFITTSFLKSELLAIRVDGKGKNDQPHIAWRYTRAVPKMGSSLLVGGEIYFVGDKGGVVTCLNAKTGKVNYTERLGGNFSSSPMFAEGKIYICSREGVTTVLQAGPTFKKLASNQLPTAIFASPVAVDDAIILRTEKGLYRVGK
jgi:outer membrane protein assembly factor BamB